MDEISDAITYKIIDVNIDGEIVRARPVEWDGDIVDNEGNKSSGEPAVPVRYETMCPKCAQMIFIMPNLKFARCPQCGVGENIKAIVDFPNPFRDPGEFVLSVPALEDNSNIDDMLENLINENEE